MRHEDWEIIQPLLCFARVHLLHCGASLWGVAPLHRAQPAQPDHDGSSAQEQGPLEPPTIRTRTFRHSNTPPRRGAWAWRRWWRRRGGRHPLIFLEVFHLPLWTVKKSVCPPAYVLPLLVVHKLWKWEYWMGGWLAFMSNGSLCWSGGLKPCRKTKE